tara:strand:+ start:81 stop:1532 length:1452 start_codon:yes stop_codon:yes gene_type:complete
MALGIKGTNQQSQVFTDYRTADEVSKGVDNLIALIDKKEDRAIRAQERAEDKKTRAQERAEDKIFTTSERVAGQEFTKSQTELTGDIESRQIKERAEETRKGQLLQGEIDINKIKTRGELEALRQKERLEFTGGENAKDRLQKGELFDKEWVNREKEWRAKLESTENLFERGNQFQKEIEQFKQDGNMEALRTRLTATASENALDREAQKILQSDRLDNSAKISELDRLSRERINNKNIIAEAVQREKDRLSREGMQEKDIEAALTRMEKGLEFDLKRYKEQGILAREQARIIKQQEADKTYSFDPQFLQGLKKEKGGLFGAGFNETDVLSAFRGDPEDPNKPNMFAGLAANVQQVMQTSANNPQRQQVLNALIEVQDQFQDPRFYGPKDKFTGESNEAFANVQAVQNLMMLMGPQGVQAIKPFDPNAQSDPVFGPVGPAIQAVGTKAYGATQDVINSLIQNMSNLPPSTPATSTPSIIPPEN